MPDFAPEAKPIEPSPAVVDGVELHQLLLQHGAHELRNQLSVVLMQLGRIEHSVARDIEGDVRAASDTVNRIALLSRLSAETDAAMSEVDLSTLADDAVRRVAGSLGKRSVDFGRIVHGEAVTVGHRGYLVEAIRNLVDNAVRHAPDGRRVVVGIGAGPVVVIDDDGPGFPIPVTVNPCVPFTTAGAPTAGVGLGLAIAQAVARLHRGDLLLGSSPSGGGRAILRLGTAPSDGSGAP